MRYSLATLACLLVGSMAQAQNTGSAPLSAIDWLGQGGGQSGVPGAVVIAPSGEAPVSPSVITPVIEVAPLQESDGRILGLLPSAMTGLPRDLWRGGAVDALERALDQAMNQRLPAGQELLLTLLLAEAELAGDASDVWLLARLDALRELGALDPALSLISQAGGTANKAIFARWIGLALTGKSEDAPCAVLIDQPALAPDQATHIYCAAMAGDFETAALLFGTAGALGILPADTETLLARYLDPELFAEDPLPPPPLRPDPLTYRLFSAVGEPLPSTPLPLIFAHGDLAEEAGWKSQLHAAERLARAGVLPSDRLFSLYRDRKPAASGGIWDRVAAFQAFDAAVLAQDPARIAQTLPPLWASVQAAGLTVTLANQFGPEVAQYDLTGAAGGLAYRLALLSRRFGEGALPADADDTARFLASVAQGLPGPGGPGGIVADAVRAGFAVPGADQTGTDTSQSGLMGAALLDVLRLLAEAGGGDPAALTSAIRDLRALGREDLARRVALQALILLDRV